MSFLKIDKVYKQYDQDNVALEGFSLEIPKGNVISMVGESGSGKSSLLRIIAGLEIQSSGMVYLGDQKILNPNEKLVPGYDEIQLIHQEYKLYPNSTVEENIARPLLMYDKTYQKERVEGLLELLSLAAHRHKKPRQLSGGQQQKVAIGRALSIEPEVLLLDEPFSSLDAIQKRELIEELKHIFEALKVTVIFVTHDLDDALLLTERLFIIQNGKLIQQGSAEEVFRKPVNLYVAQLFGYLNPVPNAKNSYIRPSDIRILKNKGIPVKVVQKQYLIHYNLLTVQLDESGEIWRVEDKEREFMEGDAIFLDFDEDKVLRLEK